MRVHSSVVVSLFVLAACGAEAPSSDRRADISALGAAGHGGEQTGSAGAGGMVIEPSAGGAAGATMGVAGLAGFPASGGASGAAGVGGSGGNTVAGAGGGADGFTPAAHLPYPRVASPSGPTLSNRRVAVVSYSGDSTAADLPTFFGTLPSTVWWTSLGVEYGTGGLTVAAPITLPETAPTSLSAAQLEARLTTLPAEGNVSDRLFAVYLPEGTKWVGITAVGSCQGFGVHHEMLESGSAYFVVYPCESMGGDAATIDDVFSASSRALVNTLTDPKPKTPGSVVPSDPTDAWTSFGGNEIADMCLGIATHEAGYRLRRFWSNHSIDGGLYPCVPSAFDEPGFGVTGASAAPLTVKAGSTVTVPLSMWSSVPTGPIALSLGAKSGAASASLDATAAKNGDGFTLTLTVPSGAMPGAGRLVVWAKSGDYVHGWPVEYSVL